MIIYDQSGKNRLFARDCKIKNGKLSSRLYPLSVNEVRAKEIVDNISSISIAVRYIINIVLIHCKFEIVQNQTMSKKNKEKWLMYFK